MIGFFFCFATSGLYFVMVNKVLSKFILLVVFFLLLLCIRRLDLFLLLLIIIIFNVNLGFFFLEI